MNEVQTCSAPCGSSYTVPAGKFIGVSVASANALAHSFACASVSGLCSFSNTAQSCSVTCADGSMQTHTIPAGTFSGASQAQVDGVAASLACELAPLQCFGSPFSNTAQSCSIVCPDTGGIVTIVVPAGAVIGFTQESADALAAETACLLAFLSCGSLPPLVGSAVQTCSQECLGVTIGQIVPAGAFLAATQEESDAEAMLWCALTLAAACAEERAPDVLNVGNTAQSITINC